MTKAAHYKLGLYGGFHLKAPDGRVIVVAEVKTRGMIALLITSANGLRSRSWLQSALWGRAGAEHGRGSLRRALSKLRSLLGDDFAVLFNVTNADIQLNQERIHMVGGPQDGEFLEGIQIAEHVFLRWLEEKRGQANNHVLRLPSVVSARISPAISVIPFAPAFDEVIAQKMGDLLALELTRVLSRSSLFDVTSHLSSRKFQLSTINLADVRAQLNVDYLICGSIRLHGGACQLHVDLIEMESERIVSSQEYDFQADDVAKGDWSITNTIASDAGRSVLSSSVKAIGNMHRSLPAAHERLMGSIALMHQHRLSGFAKARETLEALIEEFPGHAVLHAWLAKWYVLSVHQGWSVETDRDGDMALRHSSLALEIDPQCSVSHAVDGLVHSNLHRNYEHGSNQMDLALEHDPNNALAWLLKGTMLAFSDRGTEGVLLTSKSRNLSPLDPYRYYFDCLSATAHLSVGDYDTALRLADRSYRANPRHTSTLRVRTIALQELGRTDEAQQNARELLTRDPGLTVENYLKFHPATAFQTGQSWAKALRDAGIPKT
ncbi:MAG: hypothetical protein AAGH82_01070 [Pseudomonadota bacterium]